MEQIPEYPQEGGTFPDTSELEAISRTKRDIESYQNYFGSEIGMGNELILDIGAGDSPFAQRVRESSDHEAKVIRLDPGYGVAVPRDTEDTVAGFAEALPFANDKFDRVVSSFMFQHLTPEQARKAASEIVRVLKPEGEAMIYASFKYFRQPDTEMVHKEKLTPHFWNWPTLVIQKPADFDSWKEDAKQEVYDEVASYVTLGKLTYKLMRWGMAKTIEDAGTNREEEGLASVSETIKNKIKRQF